MACSNKKVDYEDSTITFCNPSSCIYIFLCSFRSLLMLAVVLRLVEADADSCDQCQIYPRSHMHKVLLHQLPLHPRTTELCLVRPTTC
jgi:hypothetical protein